MTDSKDIRWDRASAEEVKRWLAIPEPVEEPHEEERVLDYPWPVSVVSQKTIWGDGFTATVNATLGFDEVFGAEDYEIRTTFLKDPPVTTTTGAITPTWRYHCMVSTDADWDTDYSSPSFDDSTWLSTTEQVFSGGGSVLWYTPPGSRIWIRASFNGGYGFTGTCGHDDEGLVWLNGVQILNSYASNTEPLSIPDTALFQTGTNHIAARGWDWFGMYRSLSISLSGTTFL